MDGYPVVTDERPVSPPEGEDFERVDDTLRREEKSAAIQRVWDIWHRNQDIQETREVQGRNPENLYQLELESAHLCTIWELPNPFCGSDNETALRNMQPEE